MQAAIGYLRVRQAPSDLDQAVRYLEHARELLGRGPVAQIRTIRGVIDLAIRRLYQRISSMENVCGSKTNQSTPRTSRSRCRLIRVHSTVAAYRSTSLMHRIRPEARGNHLGIGIVASLDIRSDNLFHPLSNCGLHRNPPCCRDESLCAGKRPSCACAEIPTTLYHAL
jgi:hypothetical protein